MEPSVSQAKLNIDYILDLAFRNSKHADFHLDYNVEPHSDPLIFYLIDALKERIRTERWTLGKWVTVGHATRLTLFTDEQWVTLKGLLRDLPIVLVGLPQSDLYMMGQAEDSPRRRYTLDPTALWNRYEMEVAMSVNNVDNAFTPQGGVDPLALCALGVALFQSATSRDCLTLLVVIVCPCLLCKLNVFIEIRNLECSEGDR